MKILIVFAHPEPRSLTGALKDRAVPVLRGAGHEVRVSDLYAMGWKATADGEDFPNRDRHVPLRYELASRSAFLEGGQLPEVAAEQEKLLWADTVILLFPFWWFSMPAILKGWVDRVFACGFAYGVGEHNETRYGDRYGEGTLAGRRAMLIVTAGGRETHYSDRGVNGQLDDLLFPIHHGILYFPGMEVLPPFVVFDADRVDDRRYPGIAAALERRLLSLPTTEPIPYRRQNGGDYELPSLRLRPGLEAEAAGGLALHLKRV